MTLKEIATLSRMGWRIARNSTPKALWKILYNFGWRNYRNMAAFERRQANGEPFFPAFVMISVTERCNLCCSGCWVSAGGKKQLSTKQLDGIIEQSKRQGSYFFGILGGEPLMYNGLWEVIERHSDCYFQIFTNATLLTDEVARQMSRLGNVTPLISIEGLKEESDLRRGRDNVYERTLAGLRACRRAKLIFGVAASIGRSNYDELVSRKHIEEMAREGAAYLWYYIYRPVGHNPIVENALSREQIIAFRHFLNEQRVDAPLFIIDTYWDDKGQAICPAATGMSHHISPAGAVEFCPPLQMAKEFLNDDASNIVEIFNNSEFLTAMRKMTAETSRGCILLENPQKMSDFLQQWQAIDSTSRGSVAEEFASMRVVAGHDMQGEEVEEKSAIYRMLKKRYFFGFGAYG